MDETLQKRTQAEQANTITIPPIDWSTVNMGFNPDLQPSKDFQKVWDTLIESLRIPREVLSGK